MEDVKDRKKQSERNGPRKKIFDREKESEIIMQRKMIREQYSSHS